MADLDPDVRTLALSIFAANGRLVSAGNDLVAHLGLTSAWWQVLAALRYAPGPLAVASIARNMGLTRQAVQRIVDLLAERGLVAFQPNPHHRRAKLVMLTPAGSDALMGAERAVAPLDRAIVARIGTPRIREAIEMLQTLTAVISEHPGVADDPSTLDEEGPVR